MKHIMPRLIKNNFFVILIAISFFSISYCQKTIKNDLVGKWSFEKDEDEFAGRYVYVFSNDGTIFLIEYENKQDDLYKRKDKAGTFQIKEGDLIIINWKTLLTPQEYKIQKSEKDIILIGNDESKIHLIKTRQCYIDEKSKR